jgi:hypothetical protein
MATDSSFDDVPRERLDLLDVALFVRAAALANVSSAGREFGLSAAAASWARGSCTAPRGA